jgi:hypothetical protein
MVTLSTVTAQSFEVRFASLFMPGRGMVFPCDALGCVDLDTLPDQAKNNYLFARAMVGRDYSSPCVCQHADAEQWHGRTIRPGACQVCGPSP